MPRYEGTDELLRGVRYRLGMSAPGEERTAHPGGPYPNPDEHAYFSAREKIAVLQNAAQVLHRALSPEHLVGMTQEQQHELRARLDDLSVELQACEAALSPDTSS